MCFNFSVSQVLLLPCRPGFGHSSTDPGAGQTSARPCPTADSFTATTDAATATPAAEACAPVAATTSQPTLLPLQASPTDPALPCVSSFPGGGIPTAHRADARAAAAEAHLEAGTGRSNTSEPFSLYC